MGVLDRIRPIFWLVSASMHFRVILANSHHGQIRTPMTTGT